MKTIISSREQGAVAPLVAILMVVFILCVALVVDLGHLHNVKVQLQRAVDAAALAGAQQLSGVAGQDDNATNVARATAAVNRVDNITDGSWVDSTSLVIELGTWDQDITATNRFSTPVDTDTANAIRLTATFEAENFFFFFSDTSTVTADAIAVSTFEEQTIPIALVSCVPTGGGSININTPGLSVCDITSYRFHADSEDTAAWTSLTFNPASQQKILEFLDADGIKTFNQVVYGTGLAHDGLENEPVSTSSRDIPVPDDPAYGNLTRGCVGNNGTSIGCGLGEDFDVTISPALTDPLEYDPLPRWHMTVDPSESGDARSDAFQKLLTQNDLLLGDQTELQALYDESIANPFVVGDHRFKQFISLQGGTYKPNYNEVLRYAGYPPVWVNNGTVIPALKAFIDDLVVEGAGIFRPTFSGDNFPFNAGNESNSGGSGSTVKLTIPVIFAGACDDWKAVSSGPVSTDNTLFYVGTADFLLTRAWLTGSCYEHGADAINVTFADPLDAEADDCGGNGLVESDDYDPEITTGLSFECAGGHPNAALEGVLRPPSMGEESKAGILKVYLVE